ncbi:DUF1028 domain-containing protein [Pseudonocardia sp. TRM90224]|uniref:DUF1028 domain-containing protein n=1 Tax=Pseudonocardia sp. TRM90224 TaxID=2812678 RepID=UPI001E2C8E3E|nr:DUF1028 domain-containing protein [Pseudonocardia sp. TRM90224]
MTISIIAGDGAGRFGAAVCSSSPAVAARTVHLRPGVGAVSSQNITDPRLGTLLLDRLAGLDDAEAALGKIVAGTVDREYRQLTVLDGAGRTAVFHGAQTLGIHAAAQGDGVVAAGNMLASESVVAALVSAFVRSEGELETRLLAALRAGLAAGGEAGPVHSAGLAVVADVEWRVTDLRVDWHDDPVAELGRLLDVWLPQRDDYVRRGLDPAAAPSYGVPGDPRA